jgi:hypothetical protein
LSFGLIVLPDGTVVKILTGSHDFT